MAQIHHRCPECGDHKHLYRGVSARWDFEAQAWVRGDLEDEVDCTNCDWTGFSDATEIAEDEEETCPIHRQPVSRCPASCNHGEA